MVTADGVLMTIEDRATTEDVNAPSKYYLVARDAYSGVELWKRKIPVWEWHLRGFRSGPPHIARRLVATAGGDADCVIGVDPTEAQTREAAARGGGPATTLPSASNAALTAGPRRSTSRSGWVSGTFSTSTARRRGEA